MTTYDPDMADEHTNDLKWSAGNSSVEILSQGQLEDGRPALMKLSPMELGYTSNR